MLGIVGGACSSSSRDPDPPGGSADAGVDAPRTPPGAVCGGFSGATCKEDQYCDYADNGCGSTDGAGTCRSRPEACPGVVQPVCGCDGKMHSNDCVAYTEGVDLNGAGGCTQAAR